MSKEFDLNKYLAQGVENIVTRALKTTLSNPAESLFMTKFVLCAKKATKIRNEAEKCGEHIPPFLIASITSECNLHCIGCYARANNACVDTAPTCQLSCDEWNKIFLEARNIGMSFILLAGGEPLMRYDVLNAAAHLKEIIFPIFTNGTMLSDYYIDLFNKNRNLIPILSIEGNEINTDKRRGNGTYQKALNSMKLMNDKKILFGASITVTSENISEVTSNDFIESLRLIGCRIIIYVEYVPTCTGTNNLAIDDCQRKYLIKCLEKVRNVQNEMLIVSFPGDERASGGCLAAGRGFFHINSHGGAEPCPFSPYSDINVKNTSLKDALKSDFFKQLQTDDALTENHIGGCALFQNKEHVEELLNNAY